MNLKYISVLNERGMWVTELTTHWPTHRRTIGVAVRKIQSEHAAAHKLIKILESKNIVSKNGNLCVTSMKQINSRSSIVGTRTDNNLHNLKVVLNRVQSSNGQSSFVRRIEHTNNFNISLNCKQTRFLGSTSVNQFGSCLPRRSLHSCIYNFLNSYFEIPKEKSATVVQKKFFSTIGQQEVNVKKYTIPKKSIVNRSIFSGSWQTLANIESTKLEDRFSSRNISSVGQQANIEQCLKPEQEILSTNTASDSADKKTNEVEEVEKRARWSRSAAKLNTTPQNKMLETATSEDNDTVTVSEKELQKVEIRFPHPKGTLHNIYEAVAQELKKSNFSLSKSYRMVPVRSGKVTHTMWNCSYKLKWPSEASFSGLKPSKAAAGKEAALKALHWLESQGKLTKDGLPLMYDRQEIKELSKLPMVLKINPKVNADMDTLIDWYRKDIEPILSEMELSLTNKDSANDEDFQNMEYEMQPVERITQISDEKDVSNRNRMLYNRLMRRMRSDVLPELKEWSEKLPISKLKSDIVKVIEDNPVVIIKGEPGCGKSTQVPQYLMEHWEESQKGAYCNIIITQPRRISAISLAEWVAYERQERIGDVVGYQVRLKSVIPRPPGGSILFCSTGILLRRLQNNPGLNGVSHIIIDEAHERDINTDLLLLLLRRAVDANPDLRLVVMSATINAELFQKYFNNAPAIHVQGFTYPVKSTFLDDDMRIPRSNLKQEHLMVPAIDTNHIANVISWVSHTRPEGAILCFLPGWSEITSVMKHLNMLDRNRHLVLPIHSRLNHEDQRRIFSSPPPGVRKIILATNIAETSITINDVVYVIDTGAHKEERLNIQLGVSTLGNQWVSQASVNQRRGRAGRVRPGECYHLYTRKLYDNLTEFPVPEILRVPLVKTVLDLKTYSKEEKAAEFLSQMPEPPSLDAITQAVDELIHLGALDENEALTPLGKRIAMFTTHPKLSKALVHSVILRCVDPIVTISTILSNESELFVGGLENKEYVRKVKKYFHPSSDHLSLVWLFQEWKTLYEESADDSFHFCRQKGLNISTINVIYRVRKLIADHLWECQLLEDSEIYKNTEADCNLYAGNDEMVKAVLFSGTGTLLFRRNWDVKKGRLKKDTNVVLTESGQRTTIISESVNFARTNFPSPFLTYFRQVQSQERRTIVLRETSVLSPLSVLLFSSGRLSIHEYAPPASADAKWNDYSLMKLHRKRDVLMLCEKNVVQRLADFRLILQNLINYFVLVEGVTDNEAYQNILGYHNEFLKTLNSMIHSAGNEIEYDENGRQRS